MARPRSRQSRAKGSARGDASAGGKKNKGAEEAFNLARKHIAETRESGTAVLNLSPHKFDFRGKEHIGDARFQDLAELPSEISGLAELQRLDLDGTQVADITPLAGLTALQKLSLNGTPVAGIKPLAGLTALQELSLSKTPVADIAPLAGLTALQKLSLSDTKVADLAPLVGLEGLSFLTFRNTPACTADQKLAELAEIKNDAERTRRTLAYLRGEDPDVARSSKNTRIEMESGKLKLAGHDITVTRPEQVRTIQQRLAEAGFDPGPVDGVAGPNTQQALQAGLDQAGIETTGEIQRDFNNLVDFLESRKEREPRPEPRPDETAPFYDDEAATQDRLNRRAVAEALGTIIDEVWREAPKLDQEEKREPGAQNLARDRTFIVHLHGRWGSGKTSILNFLRDVLLSGKIAPPEPKGRRRARPPWAVVDYNAWRNQGLGPAWWTLMDTVYREAAAQLGGWQSRDGQRLRLRHLIWRFRARWLEHVGALAVAFAVIFAVFQLDLGESWLDKAKNTGTVVAVLVAVIAFLNRFSIGTARTAKQYMELTRDPMPPLIGRYNALIEDIGRPVAVFIDDLDRCDASFVVELLQNIQTMFRQAPVLYVVAADRGWICASYEQIYNPYCEPIAEPGHSLGNMFLEKIFQLSIEVPSLPDAQRRAFWDHLIKAGQAQVTSEDRAAIEADVGEKLEKATTEKEVIEIYDEEAKRGPEHAAIAGARAFQRMHSKELVAERQHFLTQYADLLEGNPRAMKRLLNAYGFRRGFDIQSGNRSDRDALVRWTILETRWPLLADHLAGRSGGRIDGAAMDALMQTSEVRRVAQGLTREKLSTIAGAPTGD